jgi:hypothetical protein
MTIWDLDNAEVPGIAGKLHILLLSNEPTDDIYFKHYTDEFAYPVLYSEKQYGGGPLPLKFDLVDLGSKGQNNTISSVWIPDGWQIEVFEDRDFKGASLLITVSYTNLHEIGWGDKISSIKVFPP